jgi:hypothetical protein
MVAYPLVFVCPAAQAGQQVAAAPTPIWVCSTAWACEVGSVVDPAKVITSFFSLSLRGALTARSDRQVA